MAGPTEKMQLDRRVPIFYNGSPMVPPYEEGQLFNPIDTGGIVIRINDGSARIFAKVTDFPVATDCEYAGESLYVLLEVVISESTTGEQLQKLMEEHMHDGTGILVNHPQYCTVVKYGDRIRFKNGSYGIKAVFDSKIE
tara:strand:- start:53 stop:469 length:417 start_codon:yes stop_codon:yes gene_type:complete